MSWQSDFPAPPLTEAEVLSGGWSVRYVRVLRIDQAGSRALAVVDGDGAELEAEVWCFDEGHWRCGSTGGFGPLGDSGGMSGWSAGLAYKAGCAAPGETISTPWREGPRTVVADRNGLWVVIGELVDTEVDAGARVPWLEIL